MDADSLETIAWTGHGSEPVALSGPGGERGVFVLADSVSATLVASALIQGPEGVAGLANWDILVDDTSGTDIHVSHLRVAHLALGKPNAKSRRLDFGP